MNLRIYFLYCKYKFCGKQDGDRIFRIMLLFENFPVKEVKLPWIAFITQPYFIGSSFIQTN